MSGLSVRPCTRPSTFHSVSPCLMRYRRLYPSSSGGSASRAHCGASDERAASREESHRRLPRPPARLRRLSGTCGGRRMHAGFSQSAPKGASEMQARKSEAHTQLRTRRASRRADANTTSRSRTRRLSHGSVGPRVFCLRASYPGKRSGRWRTCRPARWQGWWQRRR